LILGLMKRLLLQIFSGFRPNNHAFVRLTIRWSRLETQPGLPRVEL
jgi:hypothetical protein